MASGIEWFPLETNLMTDDEKVFDLMDGSLGTDSFADLGRFIALLNRIYREGPALKVNRRMERRIAHDLGLDLEGFRAFIDRCVSAALFSERLWREEGVLTSRGIQVRWIRAKARSKAQGLPADVRQWSLLDEPDEQDTDVEESGELSGEPTPETKPLKKLTNSENSPLDKTREDKKRLEEKKEEDQSISLRSDKGVFDNPPAQPEPAQDAERDTASLVPPCMAKEREGACFVDSAGAPHRTPYGALEARYTEVTHRKDFAAFMAKVHGMCPAGCRASPEDVSECYALVSNALDNIDPSRGSPWALTRHVLANDRGPRHA